MPVKEKWKNFHKGEGAIHGVHGVIGWQHEKQKIKEQPTCAQIECRVVGIDGQSSSATNSMDRFINVAELPPLIMEESACIKFLFDEGLRHRRMRCKEC